MSDSEMSDKRWRKFAAVSNLIDAVVRLAELISKL
jgi:hypothetical protein